MGPKHEELTVDDAPTSINPYNVLSLSKEATADEVKSAYRKAALRHHPDKASADEKEAAHSRFQEIAFAYAVLSDPRRRSRYDATGRTEETLDLEDDDFNWTDFFRSQYKEVVNSAAIARFKEDYQGGDEERQAVLEAYTEGEGDMDFVYENVMVSNVIDDDERFRVIIDDAIAKGEVEGYKKYTKESKSSRQSRRKKAQKEEEEAREAARELGVEDELFGNGAAGGGGKGKMNKKTAGGSEDALAAIIKRRQQGREEDFFANLEAKYAPKGKKGKRTAVDEPPEEAFAMNSKTGKSRRTK